MQKDTDVLNVRLQVEPLLCALHTVALTHSSFSSIIPIESVSVHVDGRWIVSSIQLNSVARQTVYPAGFFFRF